MTISPPEPEAKVKVSVDSDPVPASFEKWGKPGHFNRSLSKGPQTTTWIWNLHADAHDFDSQTSDLEDVSRKIFSAHFGTPCSYLHLAERCVFSRRSLLQLHRLVSRSD